MKNTFNKIFSRFKDKIRNVSDKTMFSLGRKKFLLKSIARYKARLLIFSLSQRSGRISPRLRRLSNFLDKILKFYSHHGALTTVKWLKASNVALQRYISGNPCKTLREIEPSLPLPRLSNGLPTFIGTMDRKAIRMLNPNTIRMWLTITSIFRIFKAPVKANLNTITDPFMGSHDTIKLISKEVSNILNKLGYKGLGNISATYPVRSLSAGPNAKVSISGLLTDAIAFAKYPELYEAFKQYAILSKSFGLYRQLDLCVTMCFNLLNKYGTAWINAGQSVSSFDNLSLGKLSFKEEAAGKLRIFAICDIWTQSLFAPLHDSLFDLLRQIPNDGTFNQDIAFKRCLDKSMRVNKAYSADLSSATDRLPLDLQIDILNIITGSKLGTYWGELLRERPFIIRKNDYGLQQDSYVWYQTGQPMGCLSSWAMLALTHHIILQYCSLHVYPNKRDWNTDYEILGDDIVIFDRLLFDRYISVMKELKVGINLAKSLISDDRAAFEFAKRTGLQGIDVSALSWKQVIAEDTLLGRVNQTIKFAEKGLISTSALLVKGLSDVRNETIKSYLSKTDIALNSLMSILGYLAHTGVISLSSAVALLTDPRDEDMDFLDNPSLPFVSTLHYVTRLLKGNWGHLIESNDSGLPQVSMFEERVELADEEMIPYMADSLVRDALSRIKLFTGRYDECLDGFARTLISQKSKVLENPDTLVSESDIKAVDPKTGKILVSYVGFDSNTPENWCFDHFDKTQKSGDYGQDVRLNSVELSQLRSLSEWALLKDRDPEELHQDLYDYCYNLRSDLPPYPVAVKWTTKVDNFISSFDYIPEGKANKVSEVPSFLREVKALGTLSETPYWRIVMS